MFVQHRPQQISHHQNFNSVSQNLYKKAIILANHESYRHRNICQNNHNIIIVIIFYQIMNQWEQ